MNTTVSENSEVPRVWQQRYERLARHYFYEFKHVGHTIVFDASTQRVSGKQNAEIEVQLQRQRMNRASAAIKECNEFRAQLESAYRVDKDLLVSAMEHVQERRLRHESNLLEHSRRANLAISASIKDLVDVAQRRHEEAKRLQRAQFADEMKCLARERQRVKQQRVLIEKKSRREIAVATAEECRDSSAFEHKQ